jgi:CheY-like chemotaxis protein
MKGTIPILLLEDDRVDAMAIKMVLRKLKVTNPLVIKSNGEEGLDYLRDKASEKPCLIFTDINMPVMNGLEFIKRVKEDESLKLIPVIVLTTSGERKDKMVFFGLGVAGYIIKPMDYNQFVEAMRTIKLYWTLSELP